MNNKFKKSSLYKQRLSQLFSTAYTNTYKPAKGNKITIRQFDRQIAYKKKYNIPIYTNLIRYPKIGKYVQ